MKQSDFNQIASDHVENNKCDTVFSSWSHSLPVVLHIAAKRGHDGAKGNYICILDTKLLAPEIVIMHTSTANQICSGITTWSKEFLAYGVTKGPAYQSIPFEAIRERLGTFRLLNAEDNIWFPLCSDWDLVVKDIQAITAFLPPHFQAPSAAHLLGDHYDYHAANCQRKQSNVISFSSTFSGNTSFVEDDTIMEPGYAMLKGYGEAERGTEWLRNLAYAQFGKKTVEILRKAAVPADETPAERMERYEAAQRAALGSVDKESASVFAGLAKWLGWQR